MHVPDFENNFFIIRLTKSNIPIGSLVGTSPFFYFSDSEQCECYQIWQKVAKVPKQCYQMWQNVAKGVQRGFKRSQGVPNCSKGSKGFQRESATRCGKKCQRGSKGKCYQMWQKVAKGVPKVVQGRPTLFAKAHGLERLPAALARRASAAGAP